MPNSQQPKAQTVLIFAGDPEDPIFRWACENLRHDNLTFQTFDWPEGANLPDRLLRTIVTLESPSRILLHRKAMGPREIGILSQLREALATVSQNRTVELIIGDLVRYADLQIAATLVDRIVPESVAADLLGSRSSIARTDRRDNTASPIGILSANDALSSTLKDILLEWGYDPRCLGGWSDPRIHAGALLIWDVPTLSDRWEIRLRDQSRVRPILALLGFADRTIVNRARQAGAIASLDLPFDLGDLETILNRFAVKSQLPGDQEPHPRKFVPSNREIHEASRNVRMDLGHNFRQGIASSKNRIEGPADSRTSGRIRNSSESAD